MEEEKPKVRDLRNGDWFWINKLVLNCPYLTPFDKLVYCALTYFADNKIQKVYPTIKKLLLLTGLESKTTIIDSIKELEKYCFIKVKRTKGKISEYTLLKLTDSKPVKKWFIPGTGLVH